MNRRKEDMKRLTRERKRGRQEGWEGGLEGRGRGIATVRRGRGSEGRRERGRDDGKESIKIIIH